MAYDSASTSKPAAPPTAVMVVDPLPRGLLMNAKFRRDADDILCFSVDYHLRPAPADPTLRYVWVVRIGEKTLFEKEYRPDELDNEGTLQGDRPAPDDGVEGEVQTYLECKRLVPRVGERRECISNVLSLQVKK
jgi:hypothetical protein